MADKQIGQWRDALADGIFLEKILNPAKNTNKIHGFECTPMDKYGQQKTRSPVTEAGFWTFLDFYG